MLCEPSFRRLKVGVRFPQPVQDSENDDSSGRSAKGGRGRVDEIDLREEPTDLRAVASEQAEEWSPAGVPRGSRDWHAYQAVYVEHVEPLHRLALLLCHGDRARAEDVVSDVFIQAWEPWSAGRVEDFTAYARRAVVNRVKGQARHGSVVERFRERHNGDDRGDRLVADQVAERESLWAALRVLPQGQRTALVLRYYEDLPVADTAALMGVSEGTVKSQVSDALHALHRSMEARR